MIQRLFVYGTLVPGRANAHILASLPGHWQSASVRGHLHPQGWGATLGYPALVPDADAPEVHGQLFSSEALDAHWPRIDAFEGEGYCRVLAAVRLANGSSVDAWLYALDPAEGVPPPEA
jgi:gamma-glutamylcyclotransferase (GGCT)/AIG2-like uncharacterized protein YtfP